MTTFNVASVPANEIETVTVTMVVVVVGKVSDERGPHQHTEHYGDLACMVRYTNTDNYVARPHLVSDLSQAGWDWVGWLAD